MKRKILLLLYIIGIVGWAIIFATNKPLIKRSSYILARSVSIVTQADLDTPAKVRKATSNIDWSQIDAKAVYAFNPVNNQVYYARNEDTRLPIASITKLMTVLVSLDYSSLSDSISITKQIISMDSPLGLKPTDSIRLSDLLKSALISSNNDSGNALAIFSPVGQTNFINKMNEKAQQLGMVNTHYSNPTGFIDADNFSTAKDLGILANTMINISSVLDITSREYATVHIDGSSPRNVTVYTTNNLLYTNKYVKGVKTGFTYASGECLITYFDVSKNDKLITVVLNSSDRFIESNQLYNIIEKGFK